MMATEAEIQMQRLKGRSEKMLTVTPVGRIHIYHYYVYLTALEKNVSVHVFVFTQRSECDRNPHNFTYKWNNGKKSRQ